MANAGQAKFDARASERKGITPGFSNQNGKSDRTPITGSEKDSTNKPNGASTDKDEAAKNAEQNLSNAEQNASDSPVNEGEDIDDINGMEGGSGFHPVNSFVSTASSKTLVGRFAFNKLNNKGPVGTVILLLIIVGTMMFSAQSLMPFSLLSQLRDKFDGINISNQTRSKVFLRTQLKRKDIKGATTKKVFGDGSEVYKLSKNQQAKLAAEGIELQEFEVGEGNNKQTVSALVFDDGSGTRKLVAADYDDIDVLKKLGSGVIDVDPDVNGVGKYKLDLDNIETFDTKWRTDTDFMNGYNKSSRTWRGSVGAWFDGITARFLNRFALTRKIFGKFIERVEGEQAGNTRSRVSDTINDSGVQDTSRSLETVTYDSEDEYEVETDDGKGGTTKTTAKSDNGQRGFYDGVDSKARPGVEGSADILESRGIDTDKVSLGSSKNTKAKVAEMKTKLENSVSKRVSGIANLVANSTCMILNVVGTVMLVGAAQESVQLLKVATSFLETVDKTRAGDGEGAPIHTLGNALTMKTDTVIENEDGREVVKEDMSAMQSNGIMSLYTGLAMNPYDKSVKSFTFGETVNNILGQVTTSMESFRACAIAKIAAATVSAVLDLAEIILGVLTGGVSVLAKKAGEALFGAAISVGVATVVSAITSTLIPKIVTWVIRDLVTDLAGENYGNAIMAGASKYMSSNFRNGGGSLTNKNEYLSYRVQQEAILAEQAEYERRTLSPFDVTSRHTFLGSIMNQVITLSTLPNSAVGVFSNVSSMVGGSILALMPSASAASDIEKDMLSDEDFQKTCPFLASIGAYGDAYCNPYIITDMSTIGTDPGTIEEDSHITNSVDSNGNIKEGTNLAKYVLYCGNRTSDFGIADNNIVNEIGDSAFLNTSNGTANAAIGAIPVIGDLADMFSNQAQLENAGFISGESCVAGNDSDTMSWEEGKVYQRYVEDQRIYEAVQPGYKSTVTAFLDKYYEEHPLDQSYEGILARYSGLTKDQVIAALEYEEYIKFIAEYEPEERYAFGEKLVKKIQSKIFEAEGDNSVSLLQHEVVYADVRNRAFAMA